MGKVFLDESTPPEGSHGERIQMHAEMDRVPIAGERIEVVRTGVHTALKVTGVVWLDGDGGFMPVVKCVREE